MEWDLFNFNHPLWATCQVNRVQRGSRFFCVLNILSVPKGEIRKVQLLAGSTVAQSERPQIVHTQ